MNKFNFFGKNRRGQSFSTDIVVVIVVILFGALFLVMNQIDSKNSGGDLNQKYDDASKESKIIVENLKTQEIISSENGIDVNKLLSLDHDAMREELGIKGDFAIAFEKDGNLVKIDAENNINCVGSSYLVVNGQNCGN